MNPLSPEMMTPAERRAELGEILARGLVRLHARKSSGLSAEPAESLVDLPRGPRPHAAPATRTERAP
jgi:hypothetical protein